jgi:hypothetical protein
MANRFCLSSPHYVLDLFSCQYLVGVSLKNPEKKVLGQRDSHRTRACV